MRTNTLWKKILIFTLILIIIFLIFIISINVKSSNTDNIPSTKDILEAQLERGKLQSNLSKNNIYPKYYVSRHMYNTKEKIVKDVLLENEALKWYAKKNNISVSDKELQSYMNQLIEHSKKAEEYKEFDEAAKSLNSTYESIVMGDSETYRDLLLKNKLYTKYIVDSSNTPVTEDDIEESREKNNKQWDLFVENIIKQYQKDNSYQSLLQDFKICEDLSADNVTSIKKIKSALEN